jgi:Zn-dependent protease with chaperone function
MIGLHLLMLAFAIAVTAPRALVGADWVHRSPRLGIAAWYATLVAVATAGAGAAVALAAPWQASNAPVCVAWRWCVAAARGGYGGAGRLASYALLAVAVLVAARMLATVVRAVRAGADRRREHLQTLDLAGRPSIELGATVVEHSQPAAYVVAGRRRRVVVTTGALEALAGDELAAVLAHERAHAAGRHDLIIDGIRLLQRAFPRSALLACARRELGRLVEMRADDVATRAHPRICLAHALVAMATTVTPPVPVTASAAGLASVLAASGGDALARMSRLLDPPRPLPRRTRWALSAGLAVLAAAPLGLLVAAQVFPVLGMCPTLG